MEDDARQLMCSCRDCLRLANLARDAAEEFAQVIFGVMERLSAHP